jgi:hypothetical protein
MILIDIYIVLHLTLECFHTHHQYQVISIIIIMAIGQCISLLDGKICRRYPRMGLVFFYMGVACLVTKYGIVQAAGGVKAGIKKGRKWFGKGEAGYKRMEKLA